MAAKEERVEEAPWGKYPLHGEAAKAILKCRKLPSNWVGKRLALLVRRKWKRNPPDPVDLETLGFRMRLHAKDNFCENRLLFMPQFYDVKEQRFLASVLEKNSRFVDIGANVGAYTLFASRHVGKKGKMAAVEAEPNIFRRLSENCHFNNLSEVKLFNCAVSDKTGILTLHVATHNRGENSLERQEAPHRFTTVEVPSEPLARICEQADLDRIDVLKMDIEGHEETALRPFFKDASPTLFPRWILIESPAHAPRRDLLQLLQDQGYRPTVQTETNTILKKS